MTDTYTDLELTPTQRSLMHLDTVEAQCAAAIALGRRLAADPDWPLAMTQFALLGVDEVPGLRLWSEPQSAAGVQRWADRLTATVEIRPNQNDPRKLRHIAVGEIDGVPVYVWSIVRTPITNAGVCWETDAGWLVRYEQGGEHRSVTLPDEPAADAWVAEYGQVVAR